MQDRGGEFHKPPPSEIDTRGGARIHQGEPTSKWSRTAEEIEKDFDEEHGDSLDHPAFLRKRRKQQADKEQTSE